MNWAFSFRFLPLETTSARIPAKENTPQNFDTDVGSTASLPRALSTHPAQARQKVNKESKPISQSTQSLDAEAAKSLHAGLYFPLSFFF